MTPSDRSPESLPAPRPDQIEVSRDENGLKLVYRWISPTYLFMAVFCIFWDGFLVFWYGSALSQSSPPPIMLWFPLLHVGVGIGLTYSALAGLLNRTTVTVGQGLITIRHHPLPWFGVTRLQSTDVRQLYCEERIGGRNQTASHHLSALSSDNRKIALLKNLSSPELARYLEHEIETALGIEDRHVPGEMTK
jgi:hypothetical protein